MAKKSNQQEQQPAIQPPEEQPLDEQRPPQGLTPRLSGKVHPRFRAVELVDPDSLRVAKRRANGQEYLDDPYLALPNGKGGYAISQVDADHAALMLSCHPDSGAPPTVRLATDEEVEGHLQVHGEGGHGNLIGRR